MKNISKIVPLLICLLWLGCEVPAVPTKYSEYEPILADRSILNTITFNEAKPIINTGKIYSYQNYILINELDKGYHVIDNSDPATPKNIGFLSILASREVVIRNGILYSNSSNDLISLDISDINHPKVISRTENVFPIQEPPDNLPLDPDYVANNRPANTVIIEWRRRK
ncbi:MAG: hypothetical protein HYZ54_04640 [Ignavibacteriae bacterium]|nr:hypothetical protein [Ignavibacteriota bacterium]